MAAENIRESYAIDVREVEEAIESNDVPKIQKIIEAGFKLDSGNISCLLRAVNRGNIELVLMLLKTDPHCDPLCGLENSCLFIAICIENREICHKTVQFLMNSGQNFKTYVKCEDHTLMHEAILAKDPELVRILCKAGANVNSEDHGLTPLHLTISRSYHDPDEKAVQMEIVKLLLDHGANVDALYDGFDSVDTPLGVLAQKEEPSIEIAQMLLDAGAGVNIFKDCTPLRHAVWGNHYELAELMIEAGADVNLFNRFDDSPLFRAVWLGRGIGNKEMVEMLLEHGADVNFKDDEGDNILCCAVQTGGDGPDNTEQMDVLKMILARSTQETCTISGLFSPFDSVLTWGTLEAMQLLFEHGVELENCPVAFPLHRAATNYIDARIIEYLLKTNLFDMDQKDDSGSTALFHSVRYGSTEKCTKALIVWGADVNIRKTGNPSGLNGEAYDRSSVGQAIAEGNIKLMNLLLSAGAELDLDTNAQLAASILHRLPDHYAKRSPMITTCLSAQYVFGRAAGYPISQASEALMNELPNFKKIVEQCQGELEILKTIHFYASNSLYQVLIGKDITQCVKNSDVIDRFESLKPAEEFFVYGSLLEYRVTLAQLRRRFMDEAVEELDKILGYRFRTIRSIYFNIMSHLGLRDLRVLCSIQDRERN